MKVRLIQYEISNSVNCESEEDEDEDEDEDESSEEDDVSIPVRFLPTIISIP